MLLAIEEIGEGEFSNEEQNQQREEFGKGFDADAAGADGSFEILQGSDDTIAILPETLVEFGIRDANEVVFARGVVDAESGFEVRLS